MLYRSKSDHDNSGWFIFLGLFYPVFYLQLAAIQKGVSPQFATYAVSLPCRKPARSFSNRFMSSISFQY
jgi:hypothetical protein